MKVSPTDREGTTRESSPKVSPSGEEKATREISSMTAPSSSKKPIEPSSQEAYTCDTKITFTDNDLLFGETLHNRPLYMVGYVREKKINRILIDEGSGVNILPIHTLKELGITTEELSESRLLIQGFNQGGQMSIGSIKLEIHMEDLRSSSWMHVIDAKTSYNILLGRPWVHENRIVSSSYYQCLKYLEDGIERKIVADDNPFTEVETHFADAKFYLKNYVVKGTKSNDVKSTKSDKITSKIIDTAVEKIKVDTKVLCPNLNEGKTMSSKKNLTSGLRYVPKLSIKTIAQNQVRDVALPTKRTGEGFDPNAYKFFAKAGYNPNEPSMLGKLPLVDKTKQAREGIGYNQPPPVRISIRRASNNHITFEDDVAAPNRKLSVFDRLGESTARTSVFKRLGPLKKNKNLRTSCKEEFKAKVRTVVYTKEREEDEESCCHISVNDNDPLEEEDVGDAPPELEEGVKTTIDPLKEVNIGTDEDPRPTYLSAFLEVDEEITYMNILKEYRDVFTWSYKEMPGLNPKVAVHQLAVKNGSRPIKQAQRRFRPDLVPLIKNEVNKLIEAGFIREVKYPTWISSIVPVKKKNGQIRVCVDFRDLNNACPKDEFPLPIPELMIDATTGYEAMSFMDGSSGYNQIRMAPKDEELTAFRTPKGIYCYKVMSFGLKNAGATYQRAMQNIFDDLLHKNVECYVDDLVVKSRKRSDHLKDLRMVFELLRRYQLRMNPLKCAFGVTSGKFLGFIVRHRGIEIDQAKVDAILKMSAPQNIHELKSLQGKLAYLRRFISNLVGRCQPFGHLMKKDAPFNWDETCSDAFESIKSYLAKPSVLAAPIPGKPLILYIAAQERSVGALLAQENSEGKENSLYYLSRTMTPNELNYSPIERLCLALVFSIQKMKHYFQAHVVRLISRANPIKFVMLKPVLSDRLARWYLQFQQFEIVYIPQKVVKGQALANFLADHLIPNDWELTDELPDEDAMLVEVLPPWKMYFDEATHSGGAGAGVVFITSQEEILPFSFSLKQCCFNNVAEYQALIVGLEMAVDMKQLNLQVFGDSQLVINQLLGSYEVKKPELRPYHDYAQKLIGWLGDVTLQHVRRTENKKVDALAALASTLTLPDQTQVTICKKWIVPPPNEEECIKNEFNHFVAASEAVKEEWRQPIIDYMCYGILPDDPRRRTDIRRRAPRFLYYKDTLYRRLFEGVLLRCLGEEEAIHALQEAHSRVCGSHQSGPKLHFHIKRMGYYWPTMVKDCLDYARRCDACQFHANFIHQPPEVLHPTIASWPFDAWGLDVVGPLPKSSGGHLYILAATDYFSKWAEVVALKEVKKENVANFIRVNIIHRFGIPHYIITDNGKPFDNKLMNKICDLFNFKQRKSSMYHVAANGLAEAFNKILCNLLKKVVSKSKRD
ncbi:uncharacterized protein LOC125858841 [Solanum stenotomum]|uniref:uncharacterized protein LOC125858841 n=1 Tax=Solanum stenotomum TaxID=172797 RepID=UPI0020D11B5D|nr:uncharacterized protein LOC125858841 [Solanum stenotomum]